jgi:glycosyltransferase involved in cell wall biosynthesis
VEIDLYHTDFASAKGIDELKGMTPKEKSQITSIAIPWPKRGSAPGHYLRELRAFSKEAYRRFLRRPPVDFVYAQGLTGMAFTEERIRGRLSVPVGVNLHGLEMFQPAPSWRAVIYNPFFRRAARRQLRQTDYVFSFGGKIRTLVDREGVLPQRVIEIPNAIPSSWVRDEAKQKTDDDCRFLFIGRYERRKGIEELTKALANWNGEWPFRFDFVGPIPAEKQLKHPSVTYHGSISDSGALLGILDDSDVLVCPSHSEGMPTVILEGMARGLAIIATDVGAVRLMVGSDNGILIPHPSVPLIRQAMEQLVGMPAAELEALKTASLRKVRQFTWDRVAKITLQQITEKLPAL